MKYKILSIGQCNFDNAELNKFCKKLNAEYVPCKNGEKAFSILQENNFSLVFVNRIFNTNGGCGLSFIKELKNKYPKQKVILISNYDDKQKIAVSLGALKGFGKNNINSSESLELVNNYLA